MTQRLTPRYMHISGAALVALDQGTADSPDTLEHVQKKLTVVNYVWNPNTLAYEVMVQPSTGGGAGSSAVDANLTSAGSTRVVGKFELSPTTPGSSNDYLWTRAVGASGAGSTEVDANLTSAGSTKLVGQVTVSNPTTAVTVSNPTTSVTITNPATAVTVNGQVGLSSGSSAVELTSAGSTRLVGRVDVNGTVSVTGTTSVSVSSGLVLGPSTAAIGQISSGSQTIGTVLNATSTNQIGSVALVTGTTGVMGAVQLASGSTSFIAGNVVLSSGSTSFVAAAVAVTSGVVLGAGSSANTLGNVAQGPGGSSANNWIGDGFSFSSANTSRTSVSTTVDTAVVAANANRKALVIANLSTSQTVALGMSTAAVTTGLGNASIYLPPTSQLTWGFGGGGMPNYTGNIRGINITSTTVGGGVAVTQFTNT